MANKLANIKPYWKGFAPMQYPHSQELCAYYHCKKGRLDFRRYCLEHARVYDAEAEATETQIISFPEKQQP